MFYTLSQAWKVSGILLMRHDPEVTMTVTLIVPSNMTLVILFFQQNYCITRKVIRMEGRHKILTVVVKSLDPGLKAAGLVHIPLDRAEVKLILKICFKKTPNLDHGLATHNVFSHRELC